MKSDNKAPTITPDLQQEIQSEFLLCELRDARTEFKMELGRVGLKFIRDNLDPRQRDLFTETFDELVWLGCRPRVLASTLYCYYKSRLWTPDAPERKEVKEMCARLQKSLEAIGQLQSYAGFDVLVRHVAGRDLQLARHADRGLQLNLWEVRALLRVYVDSLMIEWRPRKDILRSYGPIPCCSYTQIATGKYQFPLVSVLLECFGYRPDPRRQKFRGRRQPTGYVPSDQSLERNFRNFTATWPTFYERLRAELTEADYSDRPKDYLEYMLRPNDFVWRVALAPPTAQPLNG